MKQVLKNVWILVQSPYAQEWHNMGQHHWQCHQCANWMLSSKRCDRVKAQAFYNCPVMFSLLWLGSVVTIYKLLRCNTESGWGPPLLGPFMCIGISIICLNFGITVAPQWLGHRPLLINQSCILCSRPLYVAENIRETWHVTEGKGRDGRPVH